MIRDLNKQIDDKRNVLEARHLTSRISDVDWLAQTKAFLKKSDSQPTDIRSSEFHEVIDVRRTQYAEVEERLGLADRLQSFERHFGDS